MKRLLALDLFCGGGGVAEGLKDAGFEVVGIDVNRRHGRNYPGTFICADALNPPVRLEQFDFIWASPPCQKFSIATKGSVRGRHPDLIEPTRDLLRGHPYTCIENVQNAPIRKDLALTGQMVGLTRIIRKRFFELSFYVLQPPIPKKYRTKDWPSKGIVTITKSLSTTTHYYYRKEQGLRGRLTAGEACDVMGIRTPMTGHQVGEAIPPAYAEYIGREVLKRLEHSFSHGGKRNGIL